MLVKANKQKPEGLLELAEGGEYTQEGLDYYKNLLESQAKFIEQQQLLIRWLSDHTKNLTAKGKLLFYLYEYRLLLAPAALLLIAFITTTSIILSRMAIASDDPSFPPIDPNTTIYIQRYPVYARTNWGALEDDCENTEQSAPVSLVIISHTVSNPCHNFTGCSHQVQQTQSDWMKKGCDIGYNFLIGGEGGIYVGRGWDQENLLRTGSVGVSFIGDFHVQQLTEDAKIAAKLLLAEGMSTGMLDKDYKLVAENQTSPKRYYSPGVHVYSVIKHWDHYFGDQLVVSSLGYKNLKHFLKHRPIQIVFAIFLLLAVATTTLALYFSLSVTAPIKDPYAPDEGHGDDLGDGIQIIKRSEWLARPPMNITLMAEPSKLVRIMHTGGSFCSSYQECATKVLALQGWMVGTKNYPDIAYNYLIGGDGNVYEGRGPNVENEWNHDSIDICYIGNYLTPYDKMSDKMEQAGKRLIEKLHNDKYLNDDYGVVSHNQTKNTKSPGENIYRKIVKWPHYDPKLYFH